MVMPSFLEYLRGKENVTTFPWWAQKRLNNRDEKFCLSEFCVSSLISVRCSVTLVFRNVVIEHYIEKN